MRVLIVDDDETLISLLKRKLAEKNYVIDTVYDGEQGWHYGSTYLYDLIILDWTLPKLDGISLCRRFRKHGIVTPILLLTAKKRSQEKIQALDAGADDYLCKPFDVEELAARIRALFRRSNANTSPILSWGDLAIDPSRCQVSYLGNLIGMTTKEYQLLELFMRHSEEVFSIEEIIDNLWSSVEYPSEATVRSHLRHLRNKLKQAGLENDPIDTLRGRGYCLRSLPNDESKLQNSLPSSSFDVELSLPSKDLRENQHLSALGMVWAKHHQKSLKKVNILQKTFEAWKNQQLNQSQREEAQAIAHKLAGNLGIFGFEQGSIVAKNIEEILQANPPINADLISEFQQYITLLRRELADAEINKPAISTSLRENCPSVLIIDDDSQFSQRFSQIAFSKGINIKVTTTLSAAQQWLEKNIAITPPQVVLMRFSFSNVPQVALLRREFLSLIAELRLNTPSIPAIVIADSDQFLDRLIIARHGGALYFQQPVSPKQIFTFCQQLIECSSLGKKVMFVDDDIDLLKALPILLQPWSFQLTTLNDPRQFWDALPAIEPDLLVLDVDMPHVSGIELCKVLRNHPQWHSLPIMYISAHKDSEIGDQIRSSGAYGFVNKPFLGETLAERMLSCLDRAYCSKIRLT